VSEGAIGLLVLGLGNLLCRDDGAGIRTIEWIDRYYRAPEGAQVLDGGTLGLSLLPYLELAERAILVDAVATHAPAGSLVRLAGEHVTRAVGHHLSVHQIGVVDLLEGARFVGRMPRELVLLGVVPEALDLGVELSSSVANSIADLGESVIREAQRLGFRFAPRTELG
jgi:hydrogenase maturation protease